MISGGSTEGTREWGVHISNKALSSLPIRFENHTFRSVATGVIDIPCGAIAKEKGECLPNLVLNPINLGTRHGVTPGPEGNVLISNCTVWDNRPRPWFQLIGDNETAWSDVNLTSNVVHTRLLRTEHQRWSEPCGRTRHGLQATSQLRVVKRAPAERQAGY